MTTPGSGAHVVYELAERLQGIRDEIGELPVEQQYFAGTPALFRQGKPTVLGVGRTVTASPDLGIDTYGIHIKGFTQDYPDLDIKSGKLEIYFSANTVFPRRPECYKSLGRLTISSQPGMEGVTVGAYAGVLLEEKNDDAFTNLTLSRLAAPLGGWLVNIAQQETALLQERREVDDSGTLLKKPPFYYPTVRDIAPIYDFVHDSRSQPTAITWMGNGVNNIAFELKPIMTPVAQHK